MISGERRPEMSLEEFRLLRDIVYDHCGILIREDMKFLMERRLGARVEELGLSGFGAYRQLLRHSPDKKGELELAIELLTTNETYFFREPLQLRAFSEELLPQLRAQNGRARRLRLWSAGCSSGEEAYTLAMLVREDSAFSGWDVEVVGTDISKRVLALARKGEYGANALRSTPPALLGRYFEKVQSRFRVRPEVRAMVSFGHLNLLDQEMGQLIPRMDLIMCRNVMIYFDVAAKKKVLAGFHHKLVPGGFLLLGHSENLISFSSDFELVHLEHDLVYRRPEEA